MSDTHHHEPANTFTYLNSYCERAGDAAFWAEPINAITNAAFIIAAFLAAQLLYKQAGLRAKQLDIWALILLLAAIGTGSFLWHTAASPTTVLLDVIPILLFMNLYLIAALARVFQLKWYMTALLWCAYFALNSLGEAFLPPDTLNGSVLYLPTYFTLLLLTATAKRFAQRAYPEFVWATGIFTASLIFRTIDLELCNLLPFGTHFLWHGLNAILLYRLLAMLIAHTGSRTET